jgi:acylphosphatase
VRVGRRLSIGGRVQGVFFRQWTVEQARDLGVSGWVRNCPDGTVEAHLSGEEQPVMDLIDRMRRGPPAAEVAQVRVDEVPPEHGDRFEVRRG